MINDSGPIENTTPESKVDADVQFVRSNWKRLGAKNKGKVVVIAEGQLQGVFTTYEEARSFASKKYKVALVFIVDRPPAEKEIEFGAELEV